ncbi:MAG: hypothetical protein MSIBF_04075 [Candidatus Altiarchaeales archaeon IMC4]|nr:MAG: hypothetical protein MSIBF_04075 [Candidatus Altiarchaeales archaeon IMC4]
MDTQTAVILCIALSAAALLLGRFFGKRSAGTADISQSPVLTSLGTQIAEMKAQFSEMEKRREEVEKQKEKTDEEKEKRFQEFIRLTGEGRQQAEKNTGEQLKGISERIDAFSRTIHGTKTRGAAGEGILKQYLENPIKAGLVATNLKTDSGEVEFAWDLGDGKFIPIDSKLPDVVDLLERLSKCEDAEEQIGIKDKISAKLKREIARVRKYQNQSNTIDHCVLVVPEGALDAVPELICDAGRLSVHLCSYKEVFLVCHSLSEEYGKLKEEGELGDYKKFNTSLIKILDKIKSRTDSIDRGITMISNASDEIKTLARDSAKL